MSEVLSSLFVPADVVFTHGITAGIISKTVEIIIKHTNPCEGVIIIYRETSIICGLFKFTMVTVEIV